MKRILLSLLAVATLAAAQAPVNDNCAGSITLVPTVSQAGTTVAATAEGPVCGSFLATTVDVFYNYTPGVNEACTLLRPTGTGIDRGGVFTGACGALVPVNCVTSLTTTASLTWFGVAGVTYTIRVGKLSTFGVFTVILTTAAPLANDECGGAIALSDGINPSPPAGLSGTYHTNVGATGALLTGQGCVNGGSYGAGSFDVWYSYLATASGPTIIQSCLPPGFTAGTHADTNLEIFTGTCGALTAVNCDTDSCTTPNFNSLLTLSATSGVTYLIRLSGFSASATSTSGRGTYYLTVTPPPPSLVLAQSVTPSAVLSGNNVTINVTLTTSNGSPFDGTEAVLADTTLIGGFVGEALTNNGGGSFSLTRTATGTTGAKNVPLSASNLTLTGTATAVVNIYTVANDICSGALPIVTGPNGPFSSVGTLSANDAGFSTPCGLGSLGGSDMFYTYSPACDGNVTITTCQGDALNTPPEINDTQLTAYSAWTCGGSNTLVACNDDTGGLLCGVNGYQATITFPVLAGTTYLVRFASYSPGTTGTFILNVTLQTAQLITIGTGCGTPGTSLTGSGLPVLGATESITVTAQPFANGFLMGSDKNLANVYTPFGPCTIYLLNPGIVILLPIFTDGAGVWTYTATFPTDPSYDCFGIDLQGVVIGGAGFDFTNGLRMIFGT